MFVFVIQLIIWLYHMHYLSHRESVKKQKGGLLVT